MIKKLIRILLIVVPMIIVGKVKAATITYFYSDWDTMYPSGVDERLIQTEVRYNWFKSDNNQVTEIVNEFYSELPGYQRIDGSATNYYRYVTNGYAIFDEDNNIVSDTNKCIKSYCYRININEPTFVDMSQKEESKDLIFEINDEVVPKTGDFIVYSFISFILVMLALLFVVKKLKKNNN